MKDKVLVLKASRYKMTDTTTGELIQGTKVTYCQSLRNNVKENSKGIEIVTGTMLYSDFEVFTELPALYDMEFDMKSNTKGQAVLVPITAKFVERLMVGN